MRTRSMVRPAPAALVAIIVTVVLAALLGSASPAQAAARPGVPAIKALPGNGYVVGTWSAPATNGYAITKYQVGYRKYVAKTKVWTAWTYAFTTASVRSKKVLAVNGTLVQIKARAYNKLGAGGWSATAQMRAGVPSAAPGAKATRGDRVITVSWSAAAGNGAVVSSYRIASRSYVGTAWTAWTVTSLLASARSKTYGSLVNGRSYQFMVLAVNKFGSGPYGATVAAVPADTVAPGPVTGLTVGAITPTSIALSWTLPSAGDLTSIVVRRAVGAVPPATAAAGTEVTLSSPTAASVTATGLSASTQYSFAVFARDEVPNTSASASVSATTSAPSALQIISKRNDGTYDGYGATNAVFSPDGTKVAMYTLGQLDPVKDTNQTYDIYVRDLATDTITLLSTAMDGNAGNAESGGPTWSPDGTKIAFYSYAGNLVPDTVTGGQIYMATLATGAIQRVSSTWDGGEPDTWSAYPSWSYDSRYIAFSTSAKNMFPSDEFYADEDVFVVDVTGASPLRLISKNMVSGEAGNGGSAQPMFSPTDYRIMYYTGATNIATDDGQGVGDIVVTEMVSGASVRVTQTLLTGANAYSFDYSWSPDGVHVAFSTYATNLAQNDTNGAPDLYVDVPGDNAPVRVTQKSTLVGADDGLWWPATWSGDGSKLVFETSATNLVPDASGLRKIIVANYDGTGLTLVSTAASGESANGVSVHGALNRDGTLVAFLSAGTNLVANDLEGREDLFVKNLVTGAVVRVTETAAGVGQNPGGGASGYWKPTWSAVGDKLLFGTPGALTAGDIYGAVDGFVYTVG